MVDEVELLIRKLINSRHANSEKDGVCNLSERSRSIANDRFMSSITKKWKFFLIKNIYFIESLKPLPPFKIFILLFKNCSLSNSVFSMESVLYINSCRFLLVSESP